MRAGCPFAEAMRARANGTANWTVPFADSIESLSKLHSEILDVDISSEAHVVSEIPADMIGIVVDHDVI